MKAKRTQVDYNGLGSNELIGIIYSTQVWSAKISQNSCSDQYGSMFLDFCNTKPAQ